jgi:hypothetical protein
MNRVSFLYQSELNALWNSISGTEKRISLVENLQIVDYSQ